MTTTNEFPTVDPIANATRRAKREQVLGEDAACALCGLADIDSLTLVERSLLEAHHLVGRANDGALTVPLCRNHHAEVTEGYRDAGVPLNAPPTFLHKLAAVLRSLGAFFLAIAQRFASWAETLIAFIAWLDQMLPSWRTWKEAVK
jgi:hypothetical protein